MKPALPTSSVNGVVVAAAGDVAATLDAFAFQLARALNRRGTQKVFYCDAARTLAPAKLTTSLSRLKSACELKIRNSPAAAARVLTAIRALMADTDTATFKPIVVLIGSPLEQRRLLWALVTAGLRPRVLVVLHVDAASVPFRPETSDLFHLADLIVTESAFGARAVEHCCQEDAHVFTPANRDHPSTSRLRQRRSGATLFGVANLPVSHIRSFAGRPSDRV